MTRPVPMTGEEREKHLEMMQHPELWPMWPVLPLINRSETDREGFVVPGCIADANESGRYEVVMCTMYQLPEGIITYDEFYQSHPTKVYDSYEAMLDDGWMVD